MKVISQTIYAFGECKKCNPQVAKVDKKTKPLVCGLEWWLFNREYRDKENNILWLESELKWEEGNNCVWISLI